MRGVNLIPKRHSQLSDWHSCLVGGFPSVWLEHSEDLAKREGHSEGVPNRLVIEDGDEHVIVLDRPTTRREYEEDEIRRIEEFTKDARQFFAVDYTDKGLLMRVLHVVLQCAGRDSTLVEDEEGAFVLLEDYLGRL